MTEKQRINLIKKLVKKGKRRSKKSEAVYVADVPLAPNVNDIREEYDHLTRYTANQYINEEEA
jgi:hypothetical protein